MAIRITISATLKREPEPMIQTFVLEDGKPLKFKPEILERLITLEISLVTEEKIDG